MFLLGYNNLRGFKHQSTNQGVGSSNLSLRAISKGFRSIKFLTVPQKRIFYNISQSLVKSVSNFNKQ